ncbi:MAG: 50S ribosomal protein L13 [Candidatus Diapherotrites archaeon]|nr:50S ribosomal protein L13 [Candidatus Diapherotrites archaeon]
MTVIDGTTHRLGRLASSIAKRLLKGEQIDVVNSEKVIIIGNREQIIKKYRVRQSLQHHGNPKGGPKFYKMPNMIVKSAVRGMLPSKTTTGRDALKRFKAHIGVPPLFDKSRW